MITLACKRLHTHGFFLYSLSRCQWFVMVGDNEVPRLQSIQFPGMMPCSCFSLWLPTGGSLFIVHCLLVST